MMVKLSKSSPIPAQAEFQQKTFRTCRGDFILAHYRGWWQITKGVQPYPTLRCYKVYKLHKCLNIE